MVEVVYGGDVCECVVGCLQHKSQEERTLSVLGYGFVSVDQWLIILSHTQASSND